MRDRRRGSKHFESGDNIGQAHRAAQQPRAAHWRSEVDELASYHTDFDLQVSLELDESQGLFDEHAQYAAKQEPWARALQDSWGAGRTNFWDQPRTSHPTQHAPDPNKQRAYNYQTQGGYTQPAQRAPQPLTASARGTSGAQRGAAGGAGHLPRGAAAQRGAASSSPRGAANTISRGASSGATLRNVPGRAGNVAQLPAARSARSGIRAAASPSVVAAQAQYATGRAYAPQPTAAQPALQLSTRRPSMAPPVRSFVDDGPINYPGKRKRGWFGKLILALLVAGAGFAARNYLEVHAAPKSAPPPVAPPPAAIVQEPTPAPAAAPAEPPAAPAAPALPLTPQERRAAARAARAALHEERKREREEAREARLEARRARAEARATEAGASSSSKHSRADSEEESPSKSWKTDAQPSTPAAPPRPSHANAEADLLAPEPNNESEPAEPAQPKRPAMADNGKLRINSRPWSVVFVDGHSIGNTPQMNLVLPAGEHEITLVNDEMQLRKSLTVQIAPGETITRTLNLGE